MPACRHLDKTEIAAMLSSFTGRTKRRDRALLVLGLMTGFRISELASIKVGDVISEGEIKKDLTVSSRHMKGKRGKTRSRTVSLNATARAYLRDAVEDLQRRGHFSPETPVFRSLRHTGRAFGRSQGYRIISACARRAGLEGTIGTHSMRKTFAHNAHQDLIRRQAKGERIDPLLEASRALGHKTVQNTVAYLPESSLVIAGTVNALAALVPPLETAGRKQA